MRAGRVCSRGGCRARRGARSQEYQAENPICGEIGDDREDWVGIVIQRPSMGMTGRSAASASVLLASSIGDRKGGSIGSGILAPRL